jgi:hypothetical protein
VFTGGEEADGAGEFVACSSVCVLGERCALADIVDGGWRMAQVGL